MLVNGYTAEYAADVFRQVEGFGSFGFPESHAVSFALLTYASCWLKCHEPSAFATALVSSYPMGFYSLEQILQDARRHRLLTFHVDITYSGWDCTLEPVADQEHFAIRMGLRMVCGLAGKYGRPVEQARKQRPLRDVTDLCFSDAGAIKGWPVNASKHGGQWLQSSGSCRSLLRGTSL